jgi:hypothetical protein
MCYLIFQKILTNLVIDMMSVVTQDISVDEWKFKIEHADDEWLIRQFRGLSILLNGIDKDISDTYNRLEMERGTVLDDVYKEVIYPMENDYMDVDIQFVDIEDELERRGIDILL